VAKGSEASVEEILQSIKNVIDRDNRELRERQRTSAPMSENSQRGRDNVDATRSARDGEGRAFFADDRGDQVSGERDFDASVPNPPDPDPVTSEEADEVLDLIDMELAETPEQEAQPESDDDLNEDDGPLVAEAVRGAMQENLATLAMLSEPGAKPQIVRSGETSLEGLTRELLRPMLAKWLDDNLPAMVEKMVQAEIARIAGKRR